MSGYVKCGHCMGTFLWADDTACLCPACGWQSMNSGVVATVQQKPPDKSTGDVWLLVMKDMEERRQFGIKKYGVPVQVGNGRDHLVDLYQELLDACVYIRQEIERRCQSGVQE